MKQELTLGKVWPRPFLHQIGRFGLVSAGGHSPEGASMRMGGVTGSVGLVSTLVLLSALLGLALRAESTIAAIGAAAFLTMVLVAPWAARAGFRYGARRGVEAAIETMSGYPSEEPSGSPNADASGEFSEDR